MAGKKEPEPTQIGEGEMFHRPGHLVRRLHQICVSIFLTEAEDLNLTSVQFAALKGIERSPGIEQISLARAIAIDRQTASNVLGRLQSRGLIEKRDKDKRTKALFLTKQGRKIISVMSDRTTKIDELILSPLSDDERKQFLKTLLRLVDTNNDLSRAPMVRQTPVRQKEVAKG
jgi:MarR family transcriptional regulator, lower aerobic nicotinate degradation pathway regulator